MVRGVRCFSIVCLKFICRSHFDKRMLISQDGVNERKANDVSFVIGTWLLIVFVRFPFPISSSREKKERRKTHSYIIHYLCCRCSALSIYYSLCVVFFHPLREWISMCVFVCCTYGLLYCFSLFQCLSDYLFVVHSSFSVLLLNFLSLSLFLSPLPLLSFSFVSFAMDCQTCVV